MSYARKTSQIHRAGSSSGLDRLLRPTSFCRYRTPKFPRLVFRRNNALWERLRMGPAYHRTTPTKSLEMSVTTKTSTPCMIRCLHTTHLYIYPLLRGPSCCSRTFLEYASTKTKKLSNLFLEEERRRGQRETLEKGFPSPPPLTKKKEMMKRAESLRRIQSSLRRSGTS